MRSSSTCIYLCVLMTLAMVSPPAPAQSVDIAIVDVVSVAKGYRISRLIGRDVINNQSDEIGEIDDFIIDRDKVLLVILEVGGFLGLGTHLVAMPASAIDIETVKGKIRIKSASRGQLQKMPQFNYGKDQKK